MVSSPPPVLLVFLITFFAGGCKTTTSNVFPCAPVVVADAHDASHHRYSLPSPWFMRCSSSSFIRAYPNYGPDGRSTTKKHYATTTDTARQMMQQRTNHFFSSSSSFLVNGHYNTKLMPTISSHMKKVTSAATSVGCVIITPRRTSTTKLGAIPPSVSSSANDLSSVLLAASDSEGWRQYVPLIVSCLVILDILLGSPAASAVLAPLRKIRQEVEQENDDDDVVDVAGSQDELWAGSSSGSGGSNSQSETPPSGLRSLFDNPLSINEQQRRQRQSPFTKKNPKERVDTESIAQEALEKARNSMELRDYLERNKTDEDRMNEIRKKIDKQMEESEDGGGSGEGK